MAFDPSIILAGKQYTGPDANETMRTLADLANAQSSRANAEIARRHQEATLADLLEQQGQRRDLQEIYKANASSPQALPGALMQGGFGAQAYAAQDQASQMERQQAEVQKMMQAHIQQQAEILARPLRGIKDQAGLDNAFRAWKMSGIPDADLAQLPREYNPQTAPIFENIAKMGVPSADQAKMDATATEAEKKRTWESGEKEKDRANRTTNAAILAGQKSAKDAADSVKDLRKEINSDKRIAKYRQASAELDSLKTLAKTDSGASDMAIVFAFMKAMDPESVVRESEYSAAAATGTPDQRMMGLVKKWWTGGPLSNGQRQAFIRAAEAAQSGHKTSYGNAVKTFRYGAKKRGIDLIELGIEEPEGPHGPSVTQDGQTYKWNPSSGDYDL